MPPCKFTQNTRPIKERHVRRSIRIGKWLADSRSEDGCTRSSSNTYFTNLSMNPSRGAETRGSFSENIPEHCPC